MGWIICVAMLVAGLIMKNDAMIVTSGLFAIAGSIAFGSINIKTVLEKIKG